MLSHFSYVQLFVAPWTVAHQAPLSMGFSRQEYWSGLPRPPPGDLPDPGLEPMYVMSPALTCGLFTTELPVCVQFLSHVQLFVTPWTVACKAPLPMGFSRQEYWSGLPFPPAVNLPDPGIEYPVLAESSALARRFFTTEPPGTPFRWDLGEIKKIKSDFFFLFWTWGIKKKKEQFLHLYPLNNTYFPNFSLIFCEVRPFI